VEAEAVVVLLMDHILMLLLEPLEVVDVEEVVLLLQVLANQVECIVQPHLYILLLHQVKEMLVVLVNIFQV
tara:strand:+ start:329 stop:541 length:213 start_codon:yes stop_codon:yes gene_type:complete